MSKCHTWVQDEFVQHSRAGVLVKVLDLPGKDSKFLSVAGCCKQTKIDNSERSLRGRISTNIMGQGRQGRHLLLGTSRARLPAHLACGILRACSRGSWDHGIMAEECQELDSARFCGSYSQLLAVNMQPKFNSVCDRFIFHEREHSSSCHWVKVSKPSFSEVPASGSTVVGVL